MRPLAELPLLLAQHADLGARHAGALADALEGLRGFVAPAASFESELLASRVADYRPDWLDAELAAGQFQWIGAGERRITVVAANEANLVRRENPEALPEALSAAFVDARARYDFHTLAERAGDGDPARFSQHLWDAVWNGAVTSDGFALLRAGLASGFELPPRAPGTHTPASMRTPASASARRRARRRALGWPGNFRRVLQPPVDESALARLELSRERARVLLDRYGVVCRDLAAREDRAFRWKDVFSALRIMELAGEVTAGLFFGDLSAPQFASPRALSLLSGPLDASRLYWLACTDPLSPAGLLPEMPQRRAGNFLVMRGCSNIATIEANGRRLWFRLEPDDPDAHAMLWPLENLLYGPGSNRERLQVEQINAAPATGSAWIELLRTRFDVFSDHRQIELLRAHEHLTGTGFAN